ncbi:nitroreductase/quinone reductase family protein [Streptomyces sp. 184]|uniref:nitroreductase/quinone reductase family protein n=1 Tax=Streptomyces sp. 184 TaxID=1827526 RepID=UPI00389122F3
MNRIQESDVRQLIEEFRANAGQVGGRYAGRRMLLLTTAGADGIAARTTPLVYVPDAERRMVVVAAPTAAGELPAWYGELGNREEVEVETDDWTSRATVQILHGAERDLLFDRAAEVDPDFAAARDAARAAAPVVALTRVEDDLPPGPLGDTLLTAHRGLRQELALLRAEVASAAAEGRPAGGLALQLRVNCLSFCQGMEIHHTGEDQLVFPMLEKLAPDLAEPLALLRREHEVLAGLIDRLRVLVGLDESGDQTPPPEPATVLDEVDKLVDELEAHLDHEEDQLVAVLNAAAF